jgi:hypothetical protein
VFKGDRPKDFKFLTEAADRDDNIRTPAASNVGEGMRKLLPLTPEWTRWPDYDRVRGFGGRMGMAVRLLGCRSSAAGRRRGEACRGSQTRARRVRGRRQPACSRPPDPPRSPSPSAPARLQWVMVNRVVRMMWPKLTAAILEEVVKAVKPILQGVIADVRRGGWGGQKRQALAAAGRCGREGWQPA